jgi:hypothetical protein
MLDAPLLYGIPEKVRSFDCWGWSGGAGYCALSFAAAA